MKHYTLGEAAKVTGVSKTTLFKAIKSGKISYLNKTSSGYEIDPSELHRVFPPIATKSLLESSDKNDKEQSRTADNTKVNNSSQAEIDLLKQVLEHERNNFERDRERLQRDNENIANLLKTQISDLQKDRDQWRQQAQQVTYLLEDKRDKKEAQVNDSWFKRIFKI
ncbi:hypothetical protein [uncultured Nostoc sp.]|uniref:hypothetical protein n=1 Tax=uncultured Nostoc sp. TaxID=340711 RepID=UPI0035CBF5E6